MITIDPPRTAPSFALRTAGLSRFLDRVRAAIGINGQIEVVLADDVLLRRLNRTWRGKNKPTDVLSFPAANENHSGSLPFAGDLAISLDTAARQAAEHGHTLRDEVRILLLHGTLHLAGYDHETDSGEMAEREAELRKKLRLRSSLIARSEDGGPDVAAPRSRRARVATREPKAQARQSPAKASTVSRASAKRNR